MPQILRGNATEIHQVVRVTIRLNWSVVSLRSEPRRTHSETIKKVLYLLDCPCLVNWMHHQAKSIMRNTLCKPTSRSPVLRRPIARRPSVPYARSWPIKKARRYHDQCES